MKSFKSYLTESIAGEEVVSVLDSLGYETRSVLRSGNRIAIVTDRRSDALNRVMDIFSDHNPTLDRSERATRISSLGIVVLDSGIEIIAKPATKNVLKAEQEATEALISLISDAVEQSGRPIDILIGNARLSDVVTAGSDHIRGDPKADISIMDKGQDEVGFISHKKEGGAKAFQQYGGISPGAGRNIYEDPLVQEFISDLADYVTERTGDTTAERGLSAWRPLPPTRSGESLAARSVFGPEWDGGRTFNRESVHCIGQGSPILTMQDEGTYRLTFSESTHYPDDTSWIFSGDYRAIFAATYRARRRVQGRRVVIDNMRAGIYPYDFIKNRKADEI